MKPEVQMRIFIWNIKTNPFPHLKTEYGHGPRVTIESDWLTRSIDGSYLVIEVQIYQIN